LLVFGRGYNFSSCTRRKEYLRDIYIHAEGYPAAEMKHGPFLIDEQMPVVVIAQNKVIMIRFK
jgi:glucosamine 6-phosphate synthetase-like amidotransferase/phosphosugar isomerase protein